VRSPWPPTPSASRRLRLVFLVRRRIGWGQRAVFGLLLETGPAIRLALWRQPSPLWRITSPFPPQAR